VVGKAMGGGLPFAAVGGRQDIMELTDPRAGMPAVPVSMTYPGHPLACAAAVAQLGLLGPAEYDHMCRLVQKIADGVERLADATGLPLSATTAQHLFFLHWHDGPVRTWYDHRDCDDDVLATIQDRLLERGIYLGNKGRACVSVAHSDSDIAQFLDALATSVADLSA
jgi:glutamate-1-semialdehyde 2,1-aminomutase